MNRRTAVLLACAMLVWFDLANADVEAAIMRALLIGVGNYPTLPPDKSLPGAVNDVRLLRRVLLAEGFAPERVRVLAEGIEGAAMPTRAGILAALDRLVEQANAEDLVVLHFSGHGSQQPATGAGEPDGRDEIFLPRDIGRWDGKSGHVVNAIVDDEIGQRIDALRGNGAHVWALFDTCHAGTMVRGFADRENRERQILPAMLGIPALRAPPPRARGGPAPIADEDFGRIGAGLPGSLVAFYASQAHETTPERRLPFYGEQRDWYGLFTWTLAGVLQDRYGMTYRRLAHRVLQDYRAQNLRRPTPLFTGALKRAVLGRKGVDTAPQWPIRAGRAGFRIPVGELGGVGVGSELVVLRGC